MTRNNKMVLGVAAGVAALAVAGVYAKRKGYLNNINTGNLQDKFNSLKDTAMKAFNGGNTTENGSTETTGNSMNSFASTNETNGAAKRKSTSTGSTGSINPATT